AGKSPKAALCRQRQVYPKPCYASLHAFKIDPPALGLDQQLGDGKPQPCARTRMGEKLSPYLKALAIRLLRIWASRTGSALIAKASSTSSISTSLPPKVASMRRAPTQVLRVVPTATRSA